MMEEATVAAVSVRKILFPIEQRVKPAFSSKSLSLSVQPLSLPIAAMTERALS